MIWGSFDTLFLTTLAEAAPLSSPLVIPYPNALSSRTSCFVLLLHHLLIYMLLPGFPYWSMSSRKAELFPLSSLVDLCMPCACT